MNDDEIRMYLRLHVLLYANDTTVLAESPLEFLAALHAVFSYCKKWYLTVNIEKTKIAIFSWRKIRTLPEFKFGSDKLEVILSMTTLELNLTTMVNLTKKQPSKLN